MSRRLTKFFFLSPRRLVGHLTLMSSPSPCHLATPIHVIKCLHFYRPLLRSLTSSTTDTVAGRLASSWSMKCKVNRKKAKRFEIVLHSSRTTFFRLSILARAYLRHTSEARGEQQLKITAQIKAVFNHLDSWYLWAEWSCDFESSPIIAAMLKMLLTCATRDVWPKKHVFRSKYHLDNLCEDCKTLKLRSIR